jgi:Zn-dependent M16 (insulinase) family peptidase
MSVKHGFELLQEKEIPELDSKARFWRHFKTGAELLSLENDDENKVFGISFRTPPYDSTGLPHIMEHSVLSGSRKYPVKEPFIELAKGSLNTFLNALTFPDKTSYPVASQNLQDFYNLVDVYMDAVLYPLIEEHTLQTEGWHHELEKHDDPLTYKGVVFNEMKGAYSSPDSVLSRYSQRSLFPDNTYGFDSGGDPQEIPNLTYEQFKTYHQTYYHPSNARIFFYGDDDPEERLRLMDAYLGDFDPITVDSEVALQPRFEEPQRIKYAYDASEMEGDDNKGMVTVNWMLAENTDPETTLGLSILTYILIGTPASPLRKALIDSGLGEDLTHGGLESNLRQMAFDTGLKGIAVDDAEAVETLVLETLTDLVEQGIDPDMVEAGVNTIEFGLRENNTGPYPRGLLLMLRSLTTWLYGGDPLVPLAYEAPLAAIKARLEADETYFEDLIRRYLLENPHRVTVILEPDPDLRQRQEKAEAERLVAIRVSLSEQQLQALIENTRELKLRQETPDSPQALASIPSLELADLDKENKLIPLNLKAENGSEILYHDLFTNGIVYLDVGFNLRALPGELLPYVSLFSQALVKIGTEKEDFVKMSQRIGRKTGGIAPTTFTSAVRESGEPASWLLLRGKATVPQADDLLAILQDILLTVKLDNQERFRQLVLEAKARSESSLVPGGHRVVNTRLRAHFDQASWAAENLGGLSQLFFIRKLAREIERDWPAVLGKLEQVRQFLINRDNMLCNVTLDQDHWATFQPKLTGFVGSFPAASRYLAGWSPDPLPAFEGLTIPAQVNYVGKGANLYDLGYDLDGSVAVITNYLRTTWLWEKVRVQGGAYGGFCVFDHRSGVLTFLSYRDPNLLDTLEVFDGTAQFLRDLDLSEGELTKSIIGAIGTMDAYQLPDAKGYTSMTRYLTGDTDEVRQLRREQVLSTTVDDFKAFADVLERVNEAGLVAVLGSQDAIEDANESKGDWLQIQKVL